MNRALITVILSVMVVLTGFLTWAMFFDGTGGNPLLVFQGGEARAYRHVASSWEMRDGADTLHLASDYLAEYPEGKNSGKVRLIAANALYESGDAVSAKKYLVRYYVESPRDSLECADAAILLGRIQRDSGSYDAVSQNRMEDAVLEADAARKIELNSLLGYGYLYRKDYSSAVRAFSESSGEYARIGMARVYIDQGKYPEAIQEYLDFMQSYPASPHLSAVTNAFLRQASWYSGWLRGAKRDGEAKQYLEKIWKMFPETTFADDALISLAEISRDAKDDDAEALYLARAISNRVRKADERAFYLRAGLEYRQDKLSQALDDFDSVASGTEAGSVKKDAADWADLVRKELRYGRVGAVSAAR
jgi:TolA-binding protein